jgi:FkbM family methyltransferase
MCVDIRTHTEFGAFYRGEYDRECIDLLRGLWNTEGWFMDVGANIGFYTVAMAAVLPAKETCGGVMAFEPFAGNYQRLRENLALNGLEQRCEVFNFGLSSEKRRSLISLREDFRSGAGTGNASIPVEEEFDRGFPTTGIELSRLDDVWPTSRGADHRIDLIKVDIEGHEDQFLSGARQTLWRHRPTVLMEVNRPYYVARGLELDCLFLPLLPAGYRIFHRSRSTWTPTDTFEVCGQIDNVLLVPAERLSDPRYARLAAAA